jgi:hypothetical protein
MYGRTICFAFNSSAPNSFANDLKVSVHGKKRKIGKGQRSSSQEKKTVFL